MICDNDQLTEIGETEATEEKEAPPVQALPISEERDLSENTAEEKEMVHEETDYKNLLASDMRELSAEFSADSEIKITDLKNPIRYGALRDLGLTPKEAYLASGGKKERSDNRAHLSSSVPRAMTAAFSEIPRGDLEAARELFGDMSDSEIRNLYKKVTQ